MLPVDPVKRKEMAVARGCLDYFPDAIAYVALVSFLGNKQHNGDEPLHWAREKSTDHADCIARHLIERGTIDSDMIRHSGKLAWRALALLQLELEAAQSQDGATDAKDPRSPGKPVTLLVPGCGCTEIMNGPTDCQDLPNCGHAEDCAVSGP
jgi:hypothetical protein